MVRLSTPCTGPSWVETDQVGFAFDRVFDQDSQQQDIFDWGVKGIVEGQSAESSVKLA